jgi:hypothetical protein
MRPGIGEARGGGLPRARAIARALALGLACTGFVSTPAASAHRLDEYLQATLVVIEPGVVRLQMNLTPGVAVAEQVLAQVDREGKGAISPEEAAAYAAALRRDLRLRLDDRDLELKVTASQFAAPAELRSGWGMIQVEFTAETGALGAGAHALRLENRHLPAVSVYLVNAGQPTFFNTVPATAGTVVITAQKRNENQSAGEIDFTFQPGAGVGK